MKLLIATPLYPPDVGGPATYAKGLEEAFPELGHEVRVLSYGSVMRYPRWLRQLNYAIKLWKLVYWSDAVIALDTLSVGLPAGGIGRLLGRSVAVRVAGDRVWESFIARTGELVPLPLFYKKHYKLNIIERLSFVLTKVTFRLASSVVFSTTWQMEIRVPSYVISTNKVSVIENSYALDPSQRPPHKSKRKMFLWAGRDIPLKNVIRMKEAFTLAKARLEEIDLVCLTGVSHKEVKEKISQAYSLLLPSVSEDSPNFILEGIGQGKPFVTTIHNGLRDRIENLGIFVDSNNTNAIADAIVHMSTDEEHDVYSQRISEFQFIRTYKDIASEYLSIFNQLRAQ